MNGPEPPRDIKAALSRLDDHDFSSYGTNFRRLRRFATRGACRRHAAILALFIFILVATFRGTQHIFSLPSWTSSKHSECPSIRTNPHSILSPKVKDAAAIGKVWRDLHKIFDAHSPSPTTLPRPSHTQKPEKADLPSFLNISSQEALATRVQHAEVVRHLPLYPENLFQGRGIIMLAGGRYSDYAATALGMVREVGSKLPVEVWIKDKSEETKGWCAELEKEGMACRMLSDYMDMSLLPHAYQMKVFTMLFSTFQEFLFLDADDMPMSNPDVIFDGKMYKEKGAILWPDYWPHTGSPWLPYIMGISDKSSDMLADEQSVESGQVVWDKQRHWKSLCLATYYNYLGPSYYYSLLNNGWAGWGDKDTFPMALKALKEPYYQVPHEIITFFLSNHSGDPLGIGMAQADPTNTTDRVPMFLHANIFKWGMRDFLCIDCPTAESGKTFSGHVVDKSSQVMPHLREGKRIFESKELAEQGMDPEPLMWKCLEHSACRTVWGNDQVCRQARQHMTKVFGYTFEPGATESVLGFGNQACVIDPVRH